MKAALDIARLAAAQFQPRISFSSAAEREAFCAIARIPKVKPSDVLLPFGAGIDVRVETWVPRGLAIFVSAEGTRFYEIPQGYDANGSPA